MKNQIKDLCNCFEGVDRMINEGGCVDFSVWVEKINSVEMSDSN